MLKTILAGENLTLFLEQVKSQELKRLQNIALSTEDFVPTLKVLLDNNYKVDIVAIDDTSIIEDKPFQIINIKLVNK